MEDGSWSTGRWYLWAPVWGLGTFLGSMVIAIPLVHLSGQGNPPIAALASRDPGLLLAILVLAPFLETLIGQWLPIAAVGCFSRSTALKVAVSSLLFGALHLGNSWTNAGVVLLVAAPVYAYTFVRFRRESRWKAYFTTSLTHAISNSCTGLVLFTLH